MALGVETSVLGFSKVTLALGIETSVLGFSKVTLALGIETSVLGFSKVTFVSGVEIAFLLRSLCVRSAWRSASSDCGRDGAEETVSVFTLVGMTTAG